MNPQWARGDSALQVALGSTATSFAVERLGASEAVPLLRTLAKGDSDLLFEVAVLKLKAHRDRTYDQQITEMYAAAYLLLAATGFPGDRS